jgi:diguanylate cyclase (GGDEF)-like protein
MERDAIDRALGRPRRVLDLGPALETAYDLRTGTARRRQAGSILACLLVGVLLTLHLDADAGTFGLAFRLKLGIDLPLFALALAAQALPLHAIWRGLALVLPVTATVATTTVLALSSVPPFTDRYLMAAGMVGFAVNLVMPFGLRLAALLCALNVVACVGLTLPGWFGVLGSTASEDLVGFFAVLMVVTLRTVARRERAEKDAFLFRLRDELQTAELSALVDELSRLAHSDALTGVGNRRSFDLRLAAAWRAASARGAPVALVLIDVDHFKLFNDAAGHAAGDECLRAVAGAIAAGADRELESVSRYGGEEFALILQPVPGGVRGAAASAERVRLAVEALALHHPGLKPGGRVTVSIGFATARPGYDTVTPESLVENADAALYRAKRAGRNRVGSPTSLHLSAAA